MNKRAFMLLISVGSCFAQAADPNKTDHNIGLNQTKTLHSSNVQSQKIKGFYAGATIGASKLSQARDKELPAAERPDSSIASPIKTSFELLGGYQFNRIVAVELAYTDFGKLTYDNKLTKTTLPEEYSPIALSAQANVGYTFYSGWRPFGLLGVSLLDVRPSDKVNNEQDKVLEGLRIGGGVEYSPPSLAGVTFRAGSSADWYSIEYKLNSSSTTESYNDIGLLSRWDIGASYRF